MKRRWLADSHDRWGSLLRGAVSMETGIGGAPSPAAPAEECGVGG